MKAPTCRDSRGRESATLPFVLVSWAAVTAAFVRSWLFPVAGMVPMGAAEYGSAVALILAIWLGREWTEKTTGRAPS
jgi:urea transporter